MSPNLKLRKGRFSGSLPVVTITSPVATGSPPVYNAASSGSPLGSPVLVAVVAAATAVDDAAGNIASSLVWTSSLDGQVGTGANPTLNLSVGTHTVTASVTDRGGATGSDSITIVVS